MLKGEQELFNLMQDEGLEVINVSDMGITLENEPVTHAIAMEHWQTGKPSVMLTSGEPEGKNTLYWDGSKYEKQGISGSDFELACEKIVELF
jgi:hypothetical protein